MSEKREIILASASPRRKELLEQIGLEFKAEESGFKENVPEKLDFCEMAKQIAMGKAFNIAPKHPNCVIIGADTFGVIDDQIIGKPHTAEEARKMLRSLSGRSHRVISGIAVVDTAKRTVDTQSVETTVYFKELSDSEIENYVATGEPLDKAGAYAIQGLGALLVEKIEGDYYNVVGLPLFALSESLRLIGIDLLQS